MRNVTDGKKTDGYSETRKPTLRKPPRSQARVLPISSDDMLAAVKNGLTHVEQTSGGRITMLVYNRKVDSDD